MNGLSVKKIQFLAEGCSQEELERIIKNSIVDIDSRYLKFIRYFVIKEENGLSLLTFYKSYDDLKLYFNSYSYLTQLLNEPNLILNASVYEQAKILYDLGIYSKRHRLTDKFIEYLLNLSSSDCMVISTLASEILTQHGHPAVPQHVLRNHLQKEITPVELNNIRIGQHAFMFEDRINVHLYNFFESVHPSYARQCVMLNHFIKKYLEIDDPEIKCVDVGTGPGAPLLMILEMTPTLEVLAIEPSNIAYEYLIENIKNKHQVKTGKIDFLELNCNPVPLILSVGASHHFNTQFFLEKSWKILGDKGILIVADEFISSFQNVRDRMKNIILHHTSYMLSLQEQNLPHAQDNIPNGDQFLIEMFNNDIPLAAYHASIGEVELAGEICRNLLTKSQLLDIRQVIENPLQAFYRLQLIELEALVAGIDYEVEQKTSPEHFIKMAHQEGFELLEHARVHATFSSGKMDAGTHVFAFSKVTAM